jgi:hypothetical protein
VKAKIVAMSPPKKPRPRLVAITGTPVSESPLNAYTLLRLIDPALAVSRSKFQAVFTESEVRFFGGRRIQKVSGYKNLDKLRALLANISIRRTMDEVKGMPEKIWIERFSEMDDAQKAEYKNIAKQTAAHLRNSKNKSLSEEDVTTATLRLRQVINDPAILQSDAQSCKFDSLEEIADEVLEDQMAKLVVWTNFIDPIPRLIQRFKRYKPLAIYGPTTQEEISHLNKTFDHSDNRIIFVTPAKGGTGLDFLNRARVAVYIDLPWSYVQFVQSQDRIIRRTNVESDDPIEKLKGSPATLIRLHIRNTIDDLVWENLSRKMALATTATSISIDDLRMSRDEILEFIDSIEK